MFSVAGLSMLVVASTVVLSITRRLCVLWYALACKISVLCLSVPGIEQDLVGQSGMLMALILNNSATRLRWSHWHEYSKQESQVWIDTTRHFSENDALVRVGSGPHSEGTARVISAS